MVWSCHQQMLFIDFAKQASLSIFKVVSQVGLLKSCRSVKAFGNLAESLRVHAFLVSRVVKLVCLLELRLNLQLSPA